LFAGFLSAFLIELLGRLEQDPLDVVQDVLIYQTQMMRNSSLGPYVPADFSPPEHIVVVNALFYASLGVMILAAFIAMLIKSWVREFDRGLRAMSIPEQRAKTREFRYLGMERWKLPEMVGILPSLIQISLLLFAIGLMIFLSNISKPSFGVVTTILGIGIFYYTVTASISVIVSSSPFHSPLSRRLGKVYQRVHAHFCPPVRSFLSVTMDATPATTLGRVRRHIQIFLQKTRPYLENDFVEPISATTVDEVQLSTASSTLQRIHDSAPNSQHSEELHWSVWQAAGGTTLLVPPLFDLPSWIRYETNENEYFSRLPPSVLVALVAISLRSRIELRLARTTILAAGLGPTGNIKSPWAILVFAVCGLYEQSKWWKYRFTVPRTMIRTGPGILLTKVAQWKELTSEESIWLFSTLSELCTGKYLSRQAPYLIEICLEILLNHCHRTSDLLLEAVVTFAAVSCTPRRRHRSSIITSSREYPWLLLNIRSPALFGNWFENTPSDCHRSLISLLFLVVDALSLRESFPLVDQYLSIITANGDLSLYASALTAVAPAIGDDGLSYIVKMLMAQAQGLPLVTVGFTPREEYTVLEELLSKYDRHLRASENPDPNLFAILLVLSKDLSLSAIGRLEKLNLELKNPCARLVAKAVARLDIPDGSGLPMELCSDHRVQNMIAALSLLRYTEGRVTQHTESLLLASFLHSRELAISSVALEYYMKTAISYSDSSAPSSHLSQGVHSVFNPMLPDHQLRMGWRIIETFVDESDGLPVEWRRTFAEGFFSLSRQPQPRSPGVMETNTREKELKSILTWEYFHKEEQESELTDWEFSGLDWMAMAWSLHLSDQSGRKTEGSEQDEAQSRDMTAPAVKEEFVLRALCKLLDAAPDYQIIPIIPKICEFIQWFDDTDLPESRRTISRLVEEVVSRYEAFQVFHKFDKFHCMLCL